MSTAAPSLADLNQRIHGVLDELLMGFLEAVTALEMTAARADFVAFEQALRRHARVEDEAIVPVYASLGDHPRGGGPELFTADHDSLRKVLGQCLEELDALGPDPARRAMVAALPTFLRIRSVLEHHDVREERFLYVRLDAALEPEAKLPLREALEACLP